MRSRRAPCRKGDLNCGFCKWRRQERSHISEPHSVLFWLLLMQPSMLRAKGYLVYAAHAGSGPECQQLPWIPLGPIWGWEQVGKVTAIALGRRLVSKGRAIQIGML